MTSETASATMTSKGNSRKNEPLGGIIFESLTSLTYLLRRQLQKLQLLLQLPVPQLLLLQLVLLQLLRLLESLQLPIRLPIQQLLL